MKTNNKFILLFFFLIISSLNLSAQYGNGYGRGRAGYGRGYGYGRRSTIPQAEMPNKEAEPKTAEEIVEGEMPKISEAIDLNEFEQAVVRNILTTSIKKRLELQILKLDNDKTREALEKIYKTQEDDLKASLPEDKYNAFIKLQEAGFKTSKKKKKKKKKKNKD